VISSSAIDKGELHSKRDSRCCLLTSLIGLALPRLVVEDGPIEDEVILVALSEKQVLQQPTQVGIIRPVLEAQTSAIVQVCHKINWEMLAQNLHRCRHLLLHDFLVLLLLRIRPQALPWQAAAVEIHQNVADSLQIVTATLFDAQMCVNTGITRGTCQTLALPVWDVLLCFGVAILFRETEVDDVHLVGPLTEADQEIVGLDIAVDEILGMHILHAINHLICQHKNGFQTELAIAEAEEVLQGRPQEVDHHDIVVALDSIPMHIWDAYTSGEDLVKLRLIQELGMSGLDGLQLDGHLLSRLHVRAYVDVAKAA